MRNTFSALLLGMLFATMPALAFARALPNVDYRSVTYGQLIELVKEHENMSREALIKKYCPDGLSDYKRSGWTGGAYGHMAEAPAIYGFFETVACLNVIPVAESTPGVMRRNVDYQQRELDMLFGAELIYSPDEYACRESGTEDCAVYLAALTNRNYFEVVGFSDNPLDLFGSQILVSRCPVAGDITAPANGRSPAMPTETLRVRLLEMFPDAKIVCLEPGMEKTDLTNTIYFFPQPGSSNRRRLFLSGHSEFVAVDYTTGIAMRDEDATVKTVIPWHAFPDVPGMMVAVNRSDARMDDHEAYMLATAAAYIKILMDPEAHAQVMAKLALNADIKTSMDQLAPQLSDQVTPLVRNKRTLDNVREMIKIGIQGGVWSSGCISRYSFENYRRIMVADVATEAITSEYTSWCSY